MKVEALLTDVLKCNILGRVYAFVMVKETQKRHLPHIHKLITMVPRNKPRTSTDIDRVVSYKSGITLHCHMAYVDDGIVTVHAWLTARAPLTTPNN